MKKKLDFSAVGIYLYNETRVYAFVNYYIVSNTQPVDHEERMLGECYQHFDDFVEHVKKSIVPFINDGLKDTGYRVAEVGDINNAPHPVIFFTRLDHHQMTRQDADFLETRLKTFAAQRNQPRHGLYANTHKRPANDHQDYQPVSSGKRKP